MVFLNRSVARRLPHPAHGRHRKGLRTVGFFLLAAGLVLEAIGMTSFFGAMSGGGPPRYFWCSMVGLPILFVGLVLLRLGYLGAVSRYAASETAPVVADTTNYLVRETASSMRIAARAVAEGLRGEGADATTECPACHKPQPGDANFCSACGTPMPSEVLCRACQRTNPNTARFCNGCGADLAV